MDLQKVVVDLVQVALKTCDRAAMEDRCLRALTKLESLPVGNDVFLSTNIGNITHSLKSNPHLKPIVRDHASTLIDKWRRQLYSRSPFDNQPSLQINAKNLNPNQKSQLKATPVNPNPKTLSTSKVVSSHSLLKKKLLRTKPSPNLMKKQPPPQRKQALQITDADSIRNLRRQQVFEALDMVLTERQRSTGGCDPVRIAMSVEAVLFQNWGISNSYKYRSFLYNLRDPKNPDFRRKILMGELKPEKLATLTPEDMVSDMRRSQIHSIRNISLNNCIVGRG